MAYWPGFREALTNWIGVLAASMNLLGLNLSNNQFNSRPIDRYRVSKLLRDEMVIRRFYVYETLTAHNFVVFQTDSGHIFKVHLIADVYPIVDNPPIYVEISRTQWKPDKRHVWTSNKRAGDLKRFVQREVHKFGVYDVGFNDCRHFARAVAKFLAS